MKRYCLVFAVIVTLSVTFSFSGSYRHLGWANDNSPTANLAENTPEALEKEPPSSLPVILWWFLTSNDSETLTASGVASPASGPAPLSVSFTTGGNGPITMYRWDFNGDGLWDWGGSNAEDQSHTYTEAGTYTAVLQVEDEQGNTDDAQVVVTVVPAPPGITFSADDSQLLAGESTLLRWSVTDAATVAINQGIGTVSSDDTQSVSPSVTTLYTLTATGPGGTNTAAVVVTIVPTPPVITFSADDSQLFAGQSTLLRWSVTDAATVAINQGIGTVNSDETQSVSPSVTSLYTLTATGPGGTSTADVEVLVVDPEPDDLVVYILNPEDGQVVVESTMTVAGSVNQPTAQVWVNGVAATLTGQAFSAEVPLVPGVNTLSVTASYNGLTVGDSAWVVSDYVYTPQPDGSYGEQYEDLVPDDAEIPSYDKDLFSVITGLVENEQSSPVQGATVSIKKHPEYGTVQTDETGRFSLPVEGGTTHTVIYQHESYLTAHRKIDVRSNDIGIVDLVRLVVQDIAVTTVSFDGNTDTTITHISSVTTDTSGSRAMTMVFQGDNHAWEVDEHGQRIRELTTIETRATEFTTPDAMPSVLPPNSAFTYCAELSVDGASRVEFESPVVTWVDNFLGFAVGEIVPVGYYDRDTAAWVPSNNGVVVQLLDVNSDGIVDALDATGDGIPDDLNSNEIFDDEVTGLGNPSTYPPGSTFWRVEVSHFTPWDHNWPFLPPPDAVPPDPDEEPEVDEQETDTKKDDCDKEIASSIEPRSRIFHEDISVPGTDISLHYASNRVSGYQHVISIPVSGSTLPGSLESIRVKIEVAGVVKNWVLIPPLSNRHVTLLWDGYDYLDRLITSPIDAHIALGYVYKGYYANRDEMSVIDQAFAQPGLYATTVPAREEIVVWKDYVRPIQPNPSQSTHVSQIADGWTLSTHHMISPVDPTVIHKGDGTREQSLTAIMDTFAGGGTTVYTDGVDIQATEIALAHPGSVAFDSKGNAYFGSVGRTIEPEYVVWKVSPDGLITRFAGSTTESGFSGDGGPALSALLQAPWSVAIDDDDNVYIVDWSSFRVRKVDANGIITTVIGNGDVGDRCANNCKATDNTIDRPYAAAVDKDGNIYVSSSSTNTIGKVDPNGIFTTIAGGCVGAVCYNGMAGEGMPAAQVNLDNPNGLFLASDGSIYFTDGVRNWGGKIDPSGILSVIAGTGTAGYSGDGGPATQAMLNYPKGITLDPAGNIYIFDYKNLRIRKIDSHGTITTIAGSGIEGFSGDGAPATEAEMARLSGYGSLLTYHDDALFFADSWNNRIRTVKLSSPGNTGDSPTDKITYVEESGIKHIFSWNGRHEKSVDRDTGVTLRTFSYDSSNRLVAVTDQFGSVTTLQYDAYGMAESIISPDGLVTKLTVDADNHLTQITYPDTHHYVFTYSRDGSLESKTEPQGNIFSHAFDANGRLQTASDEEGGLWNYTRTSGANGIVTAQLTTAENNITNYKDRTFSSGSSESIIIYPSGNSSTIIWSDDGLTQSADLSCGMTQTSRYNIDSQYQTTYAEQVQSSTPAGLHRTVAISRTYEDTDADTIPDLISSSVDINGKASSMVHNTLISQQVTTSPEGRIVSLSYDSATLRPTLHQVPGVSDTLFTYNTKGSLTSMMQNSRNVVMDYNSKGFLNSVTAPGGQVTSYSYDAVGRVTSLHHPDGQTDMGYDASGNLTRITTPLNSVHQFSLNKTNNLASYTLPDSGGSYSYSYNKDRQLTAVTFPSGGTINNTYTGEQMTSSQTGTDSVNVTYLAGSKIESMSRGSESIAYNYDGQLLLSSSAAGTLTQTVSMSYNDDFLLTNLTYAGASQALSYDDDGLLISAGTTSITRNAASGFPEVISDSNMTQNRSYNGYGEISGESSIVNSLNIASWTASRDQNGFITEKIESMGGSSHTFNYSYDDLGRLQTVSRDGTLTESYLYDANGNRESDLAGQVYTFDSQDRLIAAGTTVYSYNPDGFLASKVSGTDTTTYNYSIRGELLTVTLPDITVIGYSYDPLGRRITKSIDGTIVEKYLWGGKANLLAVYDADDTLLIRFNYADGRTPVAMSKGGTDYYLFYDQIGSLKMVTEIDGTVVREIDYDSFGKVVNDTNSTFRVALGFAGGLSDSETGLVHFAYRDYDPEVGRWTAKDPLLFLGGDTNLYSYVANNPVNSIDAYGLSELFGMNASEWGGFIKETTLEFAGVAGDVAMVAGAATAAITAGSATVAVGGAILAGKAFMDLSLKAMNIQDELNGENKSTTGDALTQLARGADPCDETLYDAALLMSTFLNTFVGGGLTTNLDHVDDAVSYGGKLGLFDTVYKHAYDLWYGTKHRL